MTQDHLRCPKDWENAYVTGTVPWDLGRAPPVLEARIREIVASREAAGDDAAPGPRVFVPGAGRGHDARAWLAAGGAVTALDIAPTAVAEGRALDAAEGVSMTWLEADLFDLPAELDGTFDIVWEQTCFCAIDPARRGEYVEVIARLLAPGGAWMGVVWEVGRPGGPPWSLTRADIEQHFAARFDFEVVRAVAPWTKQRWDELFVELRKRS